MLKDIKLGSKGTFRDTSGERNSVTAKIVPTGATDNLVLQFPLLTLAHDSKHDPSLYRTIETLSNNLRLTGYSIQLDSYAEMMDDNETRLVISLVIDSKKPNDGGLLNVSNKI